MPDKSALEVGLVKWRLEFAETYKRHAPNWSGKTYSTWREYPHVPGIDDANNIEAQRANTARTVVRACDSLLSILKAARSKKGYVFSERRLEDFTRWYSIIESIKLSEFTRETMYAGWKALRQPEVARNAKAKKDATLKCELRREAEEALESVKLRYPEAAADNRKSFLADKAAELLGIGRSAFYRRLRSRK